MATTLAPVTKQQFFDSNGDPLSGGKIYTYLAGTTTPQATYTDQGGGTPNANPVILDSAGRANIWLDPTVSYKIRVDDSADSTIYTTDNIVGVLTADAVGTASIQASAVTTAKIADDAVTAAKLADDASVDGNRAVTTDHIRNSAVTAQKMTGLMPGAYNIGLREATTTNANDSIKITGASAALSSTNVGKVVLPSVTAGYLTEFTLTADVTINLTGAHWGFGTKGDLTDQILNVYALNNDGSLVWGIGSRAGKTLILDTDDATSQSSVNSGEKVLVNSALTADAQALQVGYFKANFDDTGGAAEDLWTVQTGDGDILRGVIPLIEHAIGLNTGNGHGSTNTYIRRFTNKYVEVGTAITHASSSTDGDSLTINEDGVYGVTYSDGVTATLGAFGISVNSNQLTTSIASITLTHRYGWTMNPSASNVGTFATTFYASKGDVVRPHTNSSPDLTSGDVMFWIFKLSRG